MKREGIFRPIEETMRLAVPKVTKNLTIKEVLKILKTESKLCESIGYIYVVEKNDKLVGVFSIKELFRLPENTKVEKFMQRKIMSVSPETKNEVVAHLALKHGISAVPVVRLGKLIGVVPPRDINHILNNSLRKDIFRFAGIHRAHLEYENTLEAPILKSVGHRTPWIILGLIGIMFTAAGIELFEKILQKHLILAFFMPAIVYLSDALGTQIQTLLIRDIAVLGKELKLGKYLLKQGVISLAITSIISAGMWLIISSFWHEPYIALVISIATFMSLLVTSFTACIITLIIEKSGGDPALGGGPFATVVSDATSILIYFLVASMLL